MKKTVIGLSLAALVLGGGASAAPGAPSTAKRDADSNGVVTRAEAQASAASLFTRMDVNKDGTLDRADRTARREATQASMFDRLDADKNGQISRTEFMANKGPRQGGPRASRRGPGPHQARADGAAGGRGMAAAMTQDQFVAAAMQRFEARDANKDGQLTQAERQAAREQRKAQRQQARTLRAQG
jgi:hypothetical protein